MDDIYLSLFFILPPEDEFPPFLFCSHLLPRSRSNREFLIWTRLIFHSPAQQYFSSVTPLSTTDKQGSLLVKGKLPFLQIYILLYQSNTTLALHPLIQIASHHEQVWTGIVGQKKKCNFERAYFCRQCIVETNSEASSNLHLLISMHFNTRVVRELVYYCRLRKHCAADP